MNLDHMTVTVRERSLPELYDLALLVIRRHALALLVLGVLGAAPWCALDLWLLNNPAPGYEALAVVVLLVLLVAQAPLATAPITAFLGEAMFNRQPRIRDALRLVAARLPTLLLIAALRGLCALLLIVGLLFFPPHLVEVVLLERQSLATTFRRGNALVSSWRAESIGHLLLGLVLVVLIGAAALAAGSLAVSVLVWSQPNEDLVISVFDLQHALWMHLVLWPILGYLAVVRFLAYIDLRTRREGWAIELDLRRAGRRIEPELES